MTKINLPGDAVDYLAEAIRSQEEDVVDALAALDKIMADKDEESERDLISALTAREEMVIKAGQLSGMRVAWGIMTGARWATEHPDLQVAEKEQASEKSAIADLERE